MNSVGAILLLFVPLVLAGTLNMIWVRSPLCRGLNWPIDGGRRLADGRRLFGANKTWQGFFGMVVFTALAMQLWELLWWLSPGLRQVWLIDFSRFQIPLAGGWLGSCWGLAYGLFELPNSFIKRRVDIAPGKNAAGAVGLTFMIVDQLDSLVGCALLLPLFYKAPAADLLAFVALGVFVHYFVSVGLYALRLKDQAG